MRALTIALALAGVLVATSAKAQQATLQKGEFACVAENDFNKLNRFVSRGDVVVGMNMITSGKRFITAKHVRFLVVQSGWTPKRMRIFLTDAGAPLNVWVAAEHAG